LISHESLQRISHMFCGDENGYFGYKSGPKLVEFFNTYFKHNDQYGQGFPSRWAYVYDRLAVMLNRGIFDDFLNLILSKEYLMRDMGFSQVQAAEHAEIVYSEFNNIVKRDQYIITYVNRKYHLVVENTDLDFVGSGGFATVYKQKSTGVILKKLKEDFLADKGIRSRFRREYSITKSLQDVYGIIEVYSYDEAACSYSMEAAETTLERYIRESVLTDEIRINCIRQILYIMSEVHKRDIIHRDLSPNNIFILRGMLKIADFGLGKDLNVFTSHQTVHTNAVGQYYYCAPEQFMLLKEGDKRSDVYSLGRVINFIMTQNPTNPYHMFRSITEKATNSDSAYRFADAGQLSIYFEKSVAIHQKQESKAIIDERIASGIFDEEIESFIYELPATSISSLILKNEPGFSNALFQFMKCDDTHAQHIIQSIDSTFRDVCRGSFTANDPFASFAYNVLSAEFPFVVKETAAKILRYVAKDVNRFSAQRLVEELKQRGLEPLLEEILDS
jgi:serine/threonine protein kinase